MELKLECTDKALRGLKWTLCLAADEVELLDEDKALVTSFARSEAPSKIRLPSFWESVAGIAVKVGDSEWRLFDKEPASVSTIRDYLDRSRILGGPAQLASLRSKGLGLLGLSALLLLTGIGVVIAIFYLYAGVAPVPRIVMYFSAIPLVLGITSGYWGIKSLRTHGRLTGLSKVEDSNPKGKRGRE